MNDNKYLKIIDELGNETEYEILFAFKNSKTNKNYVVYTNNSKDINGKLNIYASIYYPNDTTKLESIESEEEWKEIESKLKEMSKEQGLKDLI